MIKSDSDLVGDVEEAKYRIERTCLMRLCQQFAAVGYANAAGDASNKD